MCCVGVAEGGGVLDSHTRLAYDVMSFMRGRSSGIGVGVLWYMQPEIVGVLLKRADL
jgi:hypothetical protein